LRRSCGDAFQCGAANRFGFVLHGLWPDGRGGSWPQYCRPAAILPKRVIAENLCMTPSAQLLQHEWAKHGSCMAARPEEYFAKARTLYRALRLPDMDALFRSDGLSAGMLVDAVARLNPGLTRDALRVRTTRQNRLSELWICLDKALHPARCPSTKKGAPLSARLKVRPAT
jgi:ribonuclease T2